MLTPGQIFAGCRIDAVAGRGGMGVVYRATQLSLDRTVALKVIAPHYASDPAFRDRFFREAKLAASVDHPCVATVHEAGEVDETPYLIMRFIDGEDLSQVLAREGRVAPARAARVVEQVGAALEAAHDSGLVHRDVKPANIMLARGRGGAEHVFLTDFGLTRPPERSQLTATGQFIGTPDYMAPEQLTDGTISPQVDVYSLGCVLFEMLTGRVPYAGETQVRTLWAHVNDEVPTASAHGAPAAFDPVIARAMAKDPADRFPTPGELGAAAVAAAGLTQVGEAALAASEPAEPEAGSEADPVRATPTQLTPTATAGIADHRATTVAGRPQRPRSRTRGAVLGAAAVAILGSGAAAAILLVDGRERPETTTARTATTGATPPNPTVTATRPSNEAIVSIFARYGRAFSDGDLDELGSLMDDDVTRVNYGTTETEHSGRSDVLDEYRRQVSLLAGARYSAGPVLEGVEVLDPAGTTRVPGTYTIEAASGSYGGRLVLTLRVDPSGALVITRIEARPDDPSR